MADAEFWDRFNEGKMDRRTFVKVASLLGGGAVFGLPLLGCQPAASAPKATTEIKMAVPQAMIQLTGVYSANARSFFKDAGMSTALTEFAGGADQVRAVLTGGYPLAICSPAAGMTAMESGEHPRFIAAGFNAGGVGFLVKADSPLKKPEDMKGKKIRLGYSRPGSNSHIMAAVNLSSFGIDPNDKNQVEFVTTGGIPDTWTAVKTGVVDVGWSAEPTISQVEAMGEGKLLWMTWDPNFVAVLVLTSQAYIDSNAKELKTWIAAYVKALDWVKNNYDEAAKDLAQVLGIETSVALSALKKVPKEVFSASMPKKAMEATAKTSLDFKLIKAMPDLKVLINQSFLPDNLKDPSY